jgi:hypothetical protein
MSTTSPFLKLILQDLDENPDTWGNVLNVSGLETLEDAIAGTATATLASTADYTLSDGTGGPTAADGARYMILNVNGAPGGTTNIIVPTRSKIYLAANTTTDSSSIVVKTSAGTGVTIPNGSVYWVYCDGTNIETISVALADAATTATTATNSTQLGGVAAAEYAQLAVAQTWTAGQVVEADSITVTGAGPYLLTPNCANSNAFYHLTTQNFTLQAPTNATIGQRISLVVQQAAAGGPHTIAFQANTFQFAGASAPVLSTAASAVDYLAFEYYAASGGNRWLGSIIKNIGDV